MQTGIYSISSPSGKRYVGSAVDIERRWRSHRLLLCKGTHHNIGLQRAAAKYGADKLQFEILELCAQSVLLAREQWYFDNTRCHFNRYLTAGSPGPGPRGEHSPQTRARIGAAHKGRTLPREQVMKMVAARADYRPSAETRAKISASNKGKKRTDEARAKISAYQRTKKYDEATRDKISRARGAKYPGVSLHKPSNKWRARYTVNKRVVSLGYFATAEQAYEARTAFIKGL